MQKIISLFQRNYDGDRLVRDEVVSGAEWVLEGQGTATRKYDGTCCLVRDGKLYKRHEVKSGKKPPVNFEPATEVDPQTGKQQGWLPVGSGFEDQWHREAWEFCSKEAPLLDGTYELIGPKVQGNPEKSDRHVLIWHGYKDWRDEEALAHVPRTYEELKKFLADSKWEGIVWHHPDKRMVKIKRRDFFKS